MSSIESLATFSERPWQAIPRADGPLTLVSRVAFDASMVVFTHTRRDVFALVRVDLTRGSWEPIPETQDTLRYLWTGVLERAGIHE